MQYWQLFPCGSAVYSAHSNQIFIKHKIEVDHQVMTNQIDPVTNETVYINTTKVITHNRYCTTIARTEVDGGPIGVDWNDPIGYNVKRCFEQGQLDIVQATYAAKRNTVNQTGHDCTPPQVPSMYDARV
jgi:hypothetical protein